MFHWICPECGCEIPPSAKECPACDPKSVSVATAAPVAAAPAVPAAQPAPQVNGAIASASVAPPTAPPVAAAVVPVPDPAPELPLDPLLVMAEQIRSIHLEHAAAHAPVPARERAPLVEPPPVKPVIQEENVAEPQVKPIPVVAASEQGAKVPEATPAVAKVQEALPEPAAPVEQRVPQDVKVAEPPAEPIPVVAAVPAAPEPPAPVAEPQAEPAPVVAAVPSAPESPAPAQQAVPQDVRAAEPQAEPIPVVAAAPAAPVEPPVQQDVKVAEPQAEPILPVATQAPPPVESKSPEPTPEPATAPQTASPGLGELATAIGLTEVRPLAEARPGVEAEPVLDLESEQEFAAEMDAVAEEPESVPAIEQNAAVHDASVTLALLTPPFAERTRTPLLLPAAPGQEKFSPEPVAAQASRQPLSEKLQIDSAPSGSRLALAPLQDYMAAAGKAMRPAGAQPKVFAPEAGPKITLPGPTLPPELTSFKDANLVAARADEKRAKRSNSMPGWMVSMLVMMMLLTVGIAGVFYVMPSGRSNSNSDTKAAPTEAQASVTTPGTPTPSVPLAQYIEVTGFRIIVDFAKKSEIHYLVVNHSAADLADMTVYVTLQSSKAKPGTPPLCRFSFKSPGLGPFESKEMTSAIEKMSRSVTVPEWSDLHAEVQVSQ